MRKKERKKKQGEPDLIGVKIRRRPVNDEEAERDKQ